MERAAHRPFKHQLGERGKPHAAGVCACGASPRGTPARYSAAPLLRCSSCLWSPPIPSSPQRGPAGPQGGALHLGAARFWEPRCAPGAPALTPASPAGDTGSDAPLTGRSSPPAAAEKPPRPRAPPSPDRPPATPAPPTPAPAPPIPAPAPPDTPPDLEPGAGPAPGAGLERRGLPGAHARSAAARRVHSRRSFQRPRARRRPALLKLASLPPSCHAPPHALEQEETPL